MEPLKIEIEKLKAQNKQLIEDIKNIKPAADPADLEK
jgi:hypothetical protein